MKKCTKCSTEKEDELFSWRSPKNHAKGRQSWCKKCTSAYSTIWARNRVVNREHLNKIQRKSRLKKDYGLTVEDFNNMRQAQDFRCLICLRHEDTFKYGLYVDHSHETNLVRGLLCNNCNRGIGYLRDNKNCVRRAFEYLNAYPFLRKIPKVGTDEFTTIFPLGKVLRSRRTAT